MLLHLFDELTVSALCVVKVFVVLCHKSIKKACSPTQQFLRNDNQQRQPIIFAIVLFDYDIYTKLNATIICWHQTNACIVFLLLVLSNSSQVPSSVTIHLLSLTSLSCSAAACKDSKRALEVSQHAEDMGLILGACVGGLVVLILLLGAVVIIVKKGWAAVKMFVCQCMWGGLDLSRGKHFTAFSLVQPIHRSKFISIPLGSLGLLREAFGNKSGLQRELVEW